MLGRWVCTVTVIVVRRVHRVGHTIKALLRPARTVTALTGAAAIDALRPRSELMAENALLRQQILVLRRTAPPRPARRCCAVRKLTRNAPYPQTR